MQEVFNEGRFRSQVDNALNSIRKVLENERHPSQPHNLVHKYDDKFQLAEFLTNTAIRAQYNFFSAIGLDAAKFKKAKAWAANRSVTVQLVANHTCEYDREETREVESPKIVESTGIVKKETKVVTKITEYFWKFHCEWELFAYVGNTPDDKLALASSRGDCELKTSVKSHPQPQSSAPFTRNECNITWLLNQLDEEGQPTFIINREPKTCRTPRRNLDVEGAFTQFRGLYTWGGQVYDYFANRLFPIQQYHAHNLGSIHSGVFVPVVPLFERRAAGGDEAKSGTVVPAGATVNVLSVGDQNRFLSYQAQEIQAKFADLARVFPGEGAPISLLGARVAVACQHSQHIGQYHIDGINYIEDLLRKQLIAALGKEVGPADFEEYMVFHYRRLFKQQYAPKGFCYAVRRPDHYPEGIIGVEIHVDNKMPVPLLTLMSAAHNVQVPMGFNISAATKVKFLGERYLHASILHKFEHQAAPNLCLAGRARQFSSFIMVVGTVADAHTFIPKHATIIKDKDDFQIPLILETIPTPKEFKDAIESLSPEQQRFCKAFRAMQLASTLFGVVIIQIKPQLERLLNLPDDALTKEIKLTQELMDIFIKYQIPSDLISFDAQRFPNATTQDKINVVRENVQTMNNLVQESKDRELAEEMERQQMRRALQPPSAPTIAVSSSSRGFSGPPPPMPVFSPAPMMATMAVSHAPPAAPGSAMPISFASAPPPMAGGAPPPPPPAASAPPKPVVLESKAPADAPEPADKPEPEGKLEVVAEAGQGVRDYSAIPTTLDKKYEKLDEDAQVRPTILKVGPTWTRRWQRGLLTAPETVLWNKKEQRDAKNTAFDLLDALTRSGVLPVERAELHVVIMATHCFDKTLIETCVKDNMNPIEKVERSALIMASVVHETKPEDMLQSAQLERVKQFSANLFE